MQLYQLDLSKVKAIGHDGNVPLGTLQVLLEADNGTLELQSIPAPLQALEGIKLLSQLAAGKSLEIPIAPIPSPDSLLDSLTMIPTNSLRCNGSSNLKAIGYESTQKVLQVDFQSDTRYRYFDVPFTVFSQFLQSDSVGRFLNQNIKPHFEYQRVC